MTEIEATNSGRVWSAPACTTRVWARLASAVLLTAISLIGETARAEVTLVEEAGWTFFADGRVNGFLSAGFGEGFPVEIPPPRTDPNDPTSPALRSEYTIVEGWSGYRSDPSQENADAEYAATRVRSGFVGSVFGFGLKRNVTPDTVAKGYIGLWTSIASSKRRAPDSGGTPLTNTDARQGYLRLDGPWGDFTAGRDLGLFGRLSTETDFLYGHGFGVGLPCMDNAGNPACGHIGTGAMGAAFGAGLVYGTPELAGFKLTVGAYDPVRILGGWVAADYPRPEGQLSWTTTLGNQGLLKLAIEGLYQQLRYPEAPALDPEIAERAADETTDVWGVAGGGRTEIGPVRFGASAFHGRGLGFYTSLQNDPVMVNPATAELRTFTGFYGQAALVVAPFQFSLGAGQAQVAQLEHDKSDARSAVPKSQTGISAGIFYSLSDNLVFGIDYFRFTAKWHPVRNSHLEQDATTMMPVDVLDPGHLPGHEQTVNFVNTGATFIW